MFDDGGRKNKTVMISGKKKHTFIIMYDKQNRCKFIDWYADGNEDHLISCTARK